MEIITNIRDRYCITGKDNKELSAFYSIGGLIDRLLSSEYVEEETFEELLNLLSENNGGKRGQTNSNFSLLFWPPQFPTAAKPDIRADYDKYNGMLSTNTAYTTSFYRGGDTFGNPYRKVYANIIIAGGLSDELSRIGRIVELFFDEKSWNQKRSGIWNVINEYLGPKDGLSGYFEILENKQKYTGSGSSLTARFRDSYDKDPIDAVARLLIMLMTGGFAIHLVELVFPYIDGENDEKLIESIRLFNDFCYSNTKEEYENIAKKGAELYNSGIQTVEVCYVLFKCYNKFSIRPHLERSFENFEVDLCKNALEDAKNRDNENKLNLDIVRGYRQPAGELTYYLFNYYLKCKNDEACKEYLEIAQKYSNPTACEFMGDLYSGSFENPEYKALYERMNNSSISFSEDIKKAIELYDKVETGYSYFRKAKCLQKLNQIEDNQKIIDALMMATALGWDLAKEELNKYNEVKNDDNLFDEENKFEVYRNKCIVCGMNSQNINFVMTLPYSNGWEVILIDDSKSSDKIECLKQKVECVGGKFLYWDGDLISAIEGLDIVKKMKDTKVIDIENEILIVNYTKRTEEKICWLNKIFDWYENTIRENKCNQLSDLYLFSEHVLLCTELDSDTEELHLDRLERTLAQYYIPVSCNTYEKEASIELLTRLPIFSASDIYQKKSEVVISIVGNSKFVDQIIRDIIATISDVGEKIIHIYIIDKNVNEIIDALYLKSEAMMSDLNGDRKFMNNLNITGIPICIGSKEFYENIDNTLTDLYKAINNCCYMVCALNNAQKNICIGKLLRQYYLRNAVDYNYQPKIAILCKDKALLEDVNEYAISDRIKVFYSWFEGYDLVGFGVEDNYRTYEYVTNSWIKKWALAIHASYFGNADDHCVLNEYYLKEYNRDSSAMAAIRFVYRFADAGLLKTGKKWNYYIFLSAIESNTLLNEYDKYISNPINCEEFAISEHQKWNRYMLSRNWKHADTILVERYMKQGHGKVKHQLHNAHLHAYLSSWEDLGQIPGELTRFEIKKALYRTEKLYYLIDNIGDDLKNTIMNIKHVLNDLLEKATKQQFTTSLKEEINHKIGEEKEKISDTSDRYINDFKESLSNTIYVIEGLRDNESTGIQKELERLYKEILGKTLESIRKNDRNMVVLTTALIEKSRSITYRSLDLTSLKQKENDLVL